MRKMINTTLALIFSMISLSVSAQQVPCSTDEYNEQLTTPAIMQDRSIAEEAMSNRRFKTASDTAEIVIPVVFHIMHNNGPENISEARINEQMLTINEAFTASNADQVHIRDDFKGLLGNARFRFELAKQDPEGNCTNGIVRVKTPYTSSASDDIKYLSVWDTRYYLNIWVVNSIAQSPDLQGTLAGYAQFPWVSVQNREKDGIVIGYRYISRAEKTIVHEIGHYLGLLHTFQGGCSGGDYCDDTPPVAQASFGWHGGANTCSNESPDMPDMIENYMDYADKKYLFTPDQVERMRNMTDYYRSALVSKTNVSKALKTCGTTSIASEETQPVHMDIYPNPSYGRVSLNVNMEKPQAAEIFVHNLNGQTVYHSGAQQLQAGVNNISLELSELRSGVYFLRMQTQEELIVKRFIIAE